MVSYLRAESFPQMLSHDRYFHVSWKHKWLLNIFKCSYFITSDKSPPENKDITTLKKLYQQQFKRMGLHSTNKGRAKRVLCISP